MTTAPPDRPTATGGRVLLGALVPTLLVGVGTVVTGAVAAGSDAAAGAAIGAAMVCLFFATGQVVLGVVATISPSASLLIALTTYTLQVVLIALFFVTLNQSGALDTSVDPKWLGGTVIGCTLVWLTCQVIASVKVRQPIYDLPADGQEADTR